MIKTAVEHIVKSLVDKPESIIIQESTEAGKIRFTIQSDSQDIGKIIGKEGKTIKALRSLAAALSTKDNQIIIDLVK